MILLTNTDQNIEITSDASEYLQVVSSYVDIDTGVFLPGSYSVNITSSTATEIVAAPTGTAKRQIKYISIANVGTGSSVEVIITKHASGNDYKLITTSIGAGKTLEFQDGWRLFPPAVGGGSVTVPGSDTEIIYNDAGSLGTNTYIKVDIANGSIKTWNGIYAESVSGWAYLQNGSNKVAVTDGGTGRATADTAYGLIASGTTATSAQQTISPGSAGTLLRGAGTSALASFVAGVPGTATNDNATAGDVGEIVTSAVTAVAGTSTVNTNVTSIPLDAGDWFVWGHVQVESPTAATQYVAGGISTTSVTLPALGQYTQLPAAAAFTNTGAPLLPIRVSVASTTTVYLVGNVGCSGGTFTFGGRINAIRSR